MLVSGHSIFIACSRPCVGVCLAEDGGVVTPRLSFGLTVQNRAEVEEILNEFPELYNLLPLAIRGSPIAPCCILSCQS